MTNETFKFKTNINCSSCVASVAPALDSAEGICHWDIDTASADKTLLVHSNGISAQEVISTIQQAGYNIELLTTNQ